MNANGSFSVCPSTVTWSSCIDSSRTCPLARRHIRRRASSFSLPMTTLPPSLTTLSLISAANARPSAPHRASPSQHVRDLDDLAEVEVGERYATVSILLVAPQGRLHALGLDARRPEAPDRLLPGEPCGKVRDRLLEGQLK